MQDKHDEKRATLAYVWAGYKLRNAWLAESGGGRGSGRGDAAGTGEPAARWKSRRVQKDPSGVLDATARAAAEHARKAAQHAVDAADREARLAVRRSGS